MSGISSVHPFSKLGLGTSRLGSRRLDLSINQVVKLLETAWQEGINYIDTADSYCSGRSEELLGQALKAARLPFQIMTKAGFTYVQLPKPLGSFNSRAQALLHRTGYREDYRSQRIAKCLDRSLERLQMEQVAAFFLHKPGIEEISNPALIRVLENARSAGKTIRIGLSSDDCAVLDRGLEIGIFDLIQTSVHSLISAEMRELIKQWPARGHAVIGHSIMAGRTKDAGCIQEALSVPGVSRVLTGSLNIEHLKANAQAAASFQP